MTNVLVGDVYQKIIEDVIKESRSEFEEIGVSIATLNELQQEWQSKLSARNVAHMPWDPKPGPPPVQQSRNPAASPSPVANGLPPSYGYNGGAANGGPQIKTEHGADGQYAGGLSHGYPQNVIPIQGGYARAQQLVQQHQAQRGGLALPGQRPQGMQLSGQNAQQQQYAQQQYMQQQRQQAALQQQQTQPRIKVEDDSPQRQQAALQQQQTQPRIKGENDSPQLQQGGFPQQHQRNALQQQQTQPRIKVENDSPQLQQGGFQQQHQRQTQPDYAQTDGADDGLEEWQNMLAERRAANAEQTQKADGMMREKVLQQSSALQSGLMVTLDEQPKPFAGKKHRTEAGSSVPQLDGDIDDDQKPFKDEDDEDAINSDLDSDDETAGAVNAEDDDDGYTILCTYDKVQRVKNKWKCTLKDGVMSIGGKEWVFHKGLGDFEW